MDSHYLKIFNILSLCKKAFVNNYNIIEHKKANQNKESTFIILKNNLPAGRP